MKEDFAQGNAEGGGGEGEAWLLLPRAWECRGGRSSWGWEPGRQIPHNREHGPSFCPSQERAPLHLSLERDRGGQGAVLWGLFPFVIVFLLFQ